jgi:hypothetical protein
VFSSPVMTATSDTDTFNSMLDMFTLAACDDLIVTQWSTFFSVASSLGLHRRVSWQRCLIVRAHAHAATACRPIVVGAARDAVACCAHETLTTSITATRPSIFVGVSYPPPISIATFTPSTPPIPHPPPVCILSQAFRLPLAGGECSKLRAAVTTVSRLRALQVRVFAVRQLPGRR